MTIRIDGVTLHASLTLTRVMNAIEDSGGGYPGFCVACGEEASNVEQPVKRLGE